MTTEVRATGPLDKVTLGHAVAAELGISQEKGRQAVAAVLNVIARTVAAGHPVTVTNFGAFLPEQKTPRNAWNPQTGQPHTIPARTWLKFRPSPQLQEAVVAGDPDAAVITKRPRP